MERKPREWTRVKMKGERDLPEYISDPEIADDPEFRKAVADLTAAFRSNQRQREAQE
jgi:hypothetical protein